MEESKEKAYESFSPLSFVPMHTSIFFNNEKLGVGTSFIYLYEGSSYLVTNWHNISGREPNKSLKCKHTYSAIPKSLKVKIPYVRSSEIENLEIYWKLYDIPLYEDQDEACPECARWYEHPNFGREVDVVTIPLNQHKIHTSSKPEGLSVDSSGDSIIVAANAQKLNLRNVRLYPGLDVFVLGFPRGIGIDNLPIWKRASIASEPDIDIEELPKLYVDTATREGMSGSPVYTYATGHWQEEDSSLQHMGGPGIRFVGIYSGRVGQDNFKAQLGVVWKASVIDEIIQGSSKGISSHHLKPA